jgi:hypothetical protein
MNAHSNGSEFTEPEFTGPEFTEVGMPVEATPFTVQRVCKHSLKKIYDRLCLNMKYLNYRFHLSGVPVFSLFSAIWQRNVGVRSQQNALYCSSG